MLDNFDNQQQEPSEDDLKGFEPPIEKEPESEPEPLPDIINKLDEGEPVEIPVDEPSLTRKQKRQNRYKEMEERAKEAERRYEQLHNQVAMQQQAWQNAPRVPPAQQYQPPPVEENEYRSELDKLYKHRRQLYENYGARQNAGNLTPDDDSRLLADSQKLEEEIAEIRWKMNNEKYAPRQAANPGEEAIKMQLAMQYPEVFSNPQMRAYAQGTLQRNMAAGQQFSMNLLHKVFEETKKDFGLNSPKTEVDENTKRRFTGPIQGKTGTATESAKTVKVTPLIRKLANEAYSHIDDEAKRIQRWVKEIGPDYLAGLKNT